MSSEIAIIRRRDEDRRRWCIGNVTHVTSGLRKWWIKGFSCDGFEPFFLSFLIFFPIGSEYIDHALEVQIMRDAVKGHGEIAAKRPDVRYETLAHGACVFVVAG